MTTALEAPSTEPRRDRYGRYLIPDPDTGKEKSWTRATTLADTIDDRYNLELWKLRTAAVGLATRKDLLALVAAHKDDKKQLDKVCANALEAGRASESANLGTALHSLTEQIDRGASPLILDDLRADLDAYTAAMKASGLEIATLPDGRKAIECIVIVPELSVAGTFDRLYTSLGWSNHWIGDLKTGASAITYAMNSIAIQLSLYAHASHFFNPETGQLTEVPNGFIHRSSAAVVHLPVGTGECTIYSVDIEAGWEAAQLCAGVRKWRGRKNLATKIVAGTDIETGSLDAEEQVEHRDDAVTSVPATAPVEVPPASTGANSHRAWLVDRCKALAEQGHGAKLKAAWPKGLAPPKGADTWPTEDLVLIEATLNDVERECEAQFPSAPPVDIAKPEEITVDPATIEAITAEHEDPLAVMKRELGAVEIPEGRQVSHDDIDFISGEINKLAGESAALMRSIAKGMTDAGHPLKLKELRTQRRYAIAMCCLQWARNGTEKGLREELGLDPNGNLGLALAFLTTQEAGELAAKVDVPKKRTTKKDK